MGNAPKTPQLNGIYQFGAFLLDPEERLLTCEGRPILLPPRVFNTLLILVVNAGSLVRKPDLMDFVWPGASVEEVNLAHNISDLRRILGSNAIQTVPKHGYRFVEPVAKVPRKTGAQDTEDAVPPLSPTPAASRSFGRAIVLLSIAAMAVTAILIYTLPKHSAKDSQEIRTRLITKPAAVQLYLKGRYFFSRRTTQDYERAAEMYHQAIAIDPSYAEAYAGLAEALVFSSRPAGEIRAALDRALALDPNLAEVHALLGLNAMNLELNWKKAEAEFRRALQLNPNLVEAHQWYGDFLGYMGRFPASADELNAAIALDPLSPILWSDKCEMLTLASRFADAISACRYVLDMHPDYFVAHYQLVQAYILNGQMQEALDTALEAVREDDRPLALARLAQAYAALGRRNDSLALIQQLAARGDARAAPMEIAMCYAVLGDRAKALEWLERGRAVGAEMSGLKMNPMLAPLRKEPRYRALMGSIGLSD